MVCLYELVPEEWGGETIFVPISAKKGEGIDTLLEMVLLQADMLELKVNPKKQSKGVVIEAKLDKARGPVTTIPPHSSGTNSCSVNSSFIFSTFAPGKSILFTATIIGISAALAWFIASTVCAAKHLIEKRKTQEREKGLNESSMVTLDDLFSKIEQGSILFTATIIGISAALAWFIASTVCGITPSFAATTSIAISVI